MIFSVAWKNIWRNKVRSFIVVCAIALGLTGGIFSSAVLRGTSDQRIREAVSRELSHIQIHNKLYPENNELKATIDGDTERLKGMLDTLQTVQAWSSRIKFIAMAASANSGTGVMVLGIDPLKEMQVTDIHTLIGDSSGTWFDNCKGNPVILGEALAKKLKIGLHSKIVLTFQDMQGNLTGGAFRVCGIYRTNNSVYDEVNIFVKKTDIIPLLNASPGISHEIAIRLKDASMTEQTQKTIKNHFPDLLVRNWKELDPMLGLLNDFMNLWLYLFMGIILLALTFGIINTMMMAILERSREFGMLAAIGMNKRRIFLQITLESVFLSLTGGISGIILGTLLTLYTHHTGINLGSLAEGFEKLGYNPILYPSLDIGFFINLTLMVILTGIIASLFPARHALKIKPAEAIRHE